MAPKSPRTHPQRIHTQFSFLSLIQPAVYMPTLSVAFTHRFCWALFWIRPLGGDLHHFPEMALSILQDLGQVPPCTSLPRATITTDEVAYTTEIYFLRVLEAGGPRSKCWQIRFVLMPLSLACRQLPSHWSSHDLLSLQVNRRHIYLPLYLHLYLSIFLPLFLWGHQSYWIRAHTYDLTYP